MLLCESALQSESGRVRSNRPLLLNSGVDVLEPSVAIGNSKDPLEEMERVTEDLFFARFGDLSLLVTGSSGGFSVSTAELSLLQNHIPV